MSYYRNNCTIHPNKSDIGPVFSLTLKYNTKEPSFAIVWAAPLLWPYLKGHRYAIRMDHDALKYILNLADSMGLNSQLLLRISEFDFEVVQRADIRHQEANALSQLGTNNKDTNPLNDDILLPENDTHTHLKTHQQTMITLPPRSCPNQRQ